MRDIHKPHSPAAVTTDSINCTLDTDVFVPALWISTLLTARLIIYFMTGNQSTLLDLKAMSSTMEEHTAEALVGLHPFTGWDSVSSFNSKGEMKALKLMIKSQPHTKAF